MPLHPARSPVDTTLAAEIQADTTRIRRHLHYLEAIAYTALLGGAATLAWFLTDILAILNYAPGKAAVHLFAAAVQMLAVTYVLVAGKTYLSGRGLISAAALAVGLIVLPLWLPDGHPLWTAPSTGAGILQFILPAFLQFIWQLIYAAQETHLRLDWQILPRAIWIRDFLLLPWRHQSTESHRKK